jgi:Flp pilus assembly protein TadG
MTLNRTSRRTRTASRDRQGTAVVELALVAPIFFALIFGIIEFGRIVMVQQILTNSAREAARSGVLDGADFGSIQTQMQTDLENMSVPDATVTLTEIPGGDDSDDRVEATVTVDVSDISWVPGSYFLNFTPLSSLTATCTMRVESIQ